MGQEYSEQNKLRRYIVRKNPVFMKLIFSSRGRKYKSGNEKSAGGGVGGGEQSKEAEWQGCCL